MIIQQQHIARKMNAPGMHNTHDWCTQILLWAYEWEKSSMDTYVGEAHEYTAIHNTTKKVRTILDIKYKRIYLENRRWTL